MSASLVQEGDLWILTLNGSTPQNFLTLTLVTDILNKIEYFVNQANCSTRMLALVTVAGANAVSFSEGIDYHGEHDKADEIQEVLHEVVRKLLDVPARTYVLLTGLTSSMGLLFAMAHDYVGAMHDARVQMKEVMPEGRQLPPFAIVLLKDRVGNPSLLRRLALSDEQYPTQEEQGKQIDLRYAGLADKVSDKMDHHEDLVKVTKEKAIEEILKYKNRTNYVITRMRLLNNVD